jgi:hypothetical protein
MPRTQPRDEDSILLEFRYCLRCRTMANGGRIRREEALRNAAGG